LVLVYEKDVRRTLNSIELNKKQIKQIPPGSWDSGLRLKDKSVTSSLAHFESSATLWATQVIPGIAALVSPA
jgi:hypothetical protein